MSFISECTVPKVSEVTMCIFRISERTCRRSLTPASNFPSTDRVPVKSLTRCSARTKPKPGMSISSIPNLLLRFPNDKQDALHFSKNADQRMLKFVGDFSELCSHQRDPFRQLVADFVRQIISGFVKNPGVSTAFQKLFDVLDVFLHDAERYRKSSFLIIVQHGSSFMMQMFALPCHEEEQRDRGKLHRNREHDEGQKRCVVENPEQGAAQKPENPVARIEDAVRGTASVHRNHSGDGRPHDRFLCSHSHPPQSHSRKRGVEISQENHRGKKRRKQRSGNKGQDADPVNQTPEQ